jgi:hypothetical protein
LPPCRPKVQKVPEQRYSQRYLKARTKGPHRKTKTITKINKLAQRWLPRATKRDSLSLNVSSNGLGSSSMMHYSLRLGARRHRRPAEATRRINLIVQICCLTTNCFAARRRSSCLATNHRSLSDSLHARKYVLYASFDRAPHRWDIAVKLTTEAVTALRVDVVGYKTLPLNPRHRII